MADLLVETKLLVPRPRRELVPRPRLLEIVDRASHASLTLVSAPAGFGKTTLLAAMAARRAGGKSGQSIIAWVSLDERDRDAPRFWSYVLHALEKASPGSAVAALALLELGGPVEPVLVSVINEISVRQGELTLVLDDYHLVDEPDISASVGFLLEHLPPQLHIIISTRADPALPVARLRARGDLVEVRADDLRFTGAEATAYLNEVQGLDLTQGDIQALETRTEGWIAALQLAALSLRHHTEKASFIAGFAGDDHFVVDYLADEVLDQQPPELRRFLLDTSVLERMTGPLCDAVIGQRGSGAVLESLERRNLLTFPLDAQRRWYRYHQLFADVLRSRLLDERPDDVAALHHRASEWYERAGDPEAAVRHALAARELDRAADLIELASPNLRRHRAEAVIRRWVADIPAAVVRMRPVLASAFIGALMASNQFDRVEQLLDDLEAVLAGPTDGLVVRDSSEWDRLPAAIEIHRAGLALMTGSSAGTIRHAEQALALAPGDDLITPASAAALKGLASWTRGELNTAHEAYTAAAHGLAAAGHVADVLGCTVTLVELELATGRLRQAERTVTGALRLAETETSDAPVRGTADMWVALSRVTWERGELAATADHLHRAADLGDAAGLPQQPYRWRVAMAQLRAAEGDIEAAEVLLKEAERLYSGDFLPNTRPVAATLARVLARAGHLAEARAWARSRGLSAGDELTYLREYEHLTLAAALLADHTVTGDRALLADATSLLERLMDAAEAGGRSRVLIELLVLHALASEASGERQRALASLQRAVTLAEPEGWIRVFSDEGEPARRLLGLLAERDRPSAFLRVLIAAATTSTPASRPRPPDGVPGEAGTSRDTSPGSGQGASKLLVEPLSAREREVLRFLASDLDGPTIARELSVSLATVRTHTQHIYAKLGVTNRRAAVRRGHQLNL
jgi:LuxR family transcriptional regulator, maltose regulon positive regulatory protein